MKRFGLVAVLTLALAGGAAGASVPPGYYVPPGFRRAPAAEKPASWVAQRPVLVYCAESGSAWQAHVRQLGPLANEAFLLAGIELFRHRICADVTAEIEHRRVGRSAFAASLLMLIQASEPASGIHDVDGCRALARFPDVARRFFGYRFHTQPLRSLVAQAFKAHHAVFTTACRRSSS